MYDVLIKYSVLDPPKKRSKMEEMTPDVVKKRKNFKQRLSEGL